MGRSSIAAYETGRVEPSTEYLVYLHRRGLNLNWLYTGEGDMMILRDLDPVSRSFRDLEAEFLYLLSKIAGFPGGIDELELDPEVRIQLLELLTKDAGKRRSEKKAID